MTGAIRRYRDEDASGKLRAEGNRGVHLLATESEAGEDVNQHPVS